MKEKIEVIKQLEESHSKTLKGYKESGVIKYVEILPAGNSCKICKNWKGKRIPLESAIKEQLLPLESCQNKIYGYCRCCYIPVVDEE